VKHRGGATRCSRRSPPRPFPLPGVPDYPARIERSPTPEKYVEIPALFRAWVPSLSNRRLAAKSNGPITAGPRNGVTLAYDRKHDCCGVSSP
jgi:hypothetical protein